MKKRMMWAAVATLSSAVHATDIHVNGFCGNDLWSGLSTLCAVPDGPKATIQAAIDAAINGDVVIVAQSEYFESINFNGKAITVRSLVPTDPGVVMNTIINGNDALHVVTCDTGEGPDSVLSGFVITGGNANGGTPDDQGGGMFNDGSSPAVNNCSFIGNMASGMGGGMINRNGSPTVTNCSFIGNTANGTGGGGMCNLGDSSPVTNCTFSGNVAAGGNGGGLFNFVSRSLVTNCTFSGNSAGSGGGMSTLVGGGAVTDCTFNENTADFSGGGMWNQIDSTVVTNTGFCGNTPDAIDGDPIIDGGGNSMLYCGPPSRFCPADLNSDGYVGVRDLLDVLGAWGACQ